MYRGSLKSCNFHCAYCPFAWKKIVHQDLETDKAGISRFIEFIENSQHHYRILFTPYGEAMIHAYYREAMVRLSKLPNVIKVAVQTNGSFSVTADDWLDRIAADTAAFWLSFHPEQISLEQFTNQYQALLDRNLRFSCGVVGIKTNIPTIRQLRATLPQFVYMWINAYKRWHGYYTDKEIEELVLLDPLFNNNLHYYPSRGHICRTGQEIFSVDEKGDIRRCHFVDTIIGNISENDMANLHCSPHCPNDTCHCHIGYIYLPELHQHSIYGDGMLERIPCQYKMG